MFLILRLSLRSSASRRMLMGGFEFNNEEKIPENWKNRVAPYTVADVTAEIFAQYLEYPVEFGGNAGAGNFVPLGEDFGAVQGGYLNASEEADATCLLYQLLTERVPSSLNGFVTPTVEGLSLIAQVLNPTLSNLGCPIALT